jgi:hypothetical protein
VPPLLALVNGVTGMAGPSTSFVSVTSDDYGFSWVHGTDLPAGGAIKVQTQHVLSSTRAIDSLVVPPDWKRIPDELSMARSHLHPYWVDFCAPGHAYSLGSDSMLRPVSAVGVKDRFPGIFSTDGNIDGDIGPACDVSSVLSVVVAAKLQSAPQEWGGRKRAERRLAIQHLGDEIGAAADMVKAGVSDGVFEFADINGAGVVGVAAKLGSRPGCVWEPSGDGWQRLRLSREGVLHDLLPFEESGTLHGRPCRRTLLNLLFF